MKSKKSKVINISTPLNNIIINNIDYGLAWLRWLVALEKLHLKNKGETLNV